MARYEYRNPATGEMREVVASMKSPPPEWITINPETGEWTAAVSNDPLALRRIYGGFEINNDPLLGKPILSNTLPRNMPGAECAPDGRVIVRSREHARELARQGGYVWE